MDFSNIFVRIYIAGFIFTTILNQWLEYIDWRNRVKQGTKIPAELAGHIDPPLLRKTCEYENAKYYLWIPYTILTAALEISLFFSGFYPWLFTRMWAAFDSVFGSIALFLIIVGIPGAVLSLPFELYGEFHIEKKFGFSTMTFKLWIIDQIKELILGGIIGGILLVIMLAVFEYTAGWWWVLLGAVYVLFSLGMSILYPLVIAPVFNKFTPLEEGELRDRLSHLMQETGFKAEGVYVMDASKRSHHSNAYFTGFGKSKRIVLYDTLVKQLSVDEIEAVLAHELGHYKKHHILKRMIIMIPLVFLGLFIMSLLISNRTLYSGFGFATPADMFSHMQFVGVFLLFSIFSGYGDITGLISNYFSRHDEFEADAFAAELCGSGQPLSTGLIKLNKENLSEIMPPKIYCMFKYNHPPLLERIRAVGYKPE